MRRHEDRTEHHEVRVELRREVEGVAAAGISVPSNAFPEGTIEVPVMREEAVVSKGAHGTGSVRLGKEMTTKMETVSGDVRHEDVQVDKSAEPVEF